MKGSRFLLATVLALTLSGAALAQDRDRNENRGGRTPVQAQHQSRPDADRGSRTQPSAQPHPARQDNNHQLNRVEPTSQWQQGRQEQGRVGDRDGATAQWQQERRDGDDRGDRDDIRRNNAAYPAGAYYPNRYPTAVYSATQWLSQAQQIGYQDGLNDGSNDRATGHSFRPTEDSNYRHADRGWNSGTVDRDSYSNAYRQAYMQGYQRGFGSAGYGY